MAIMTVTEKEHIENKHSLMLQTQAVKWRDEAKKALGLRSWHAVVAKQACSRLILIAFLQNRWLKNVVQKNAVSTPEKDDIPA